MVIERTAVLRTSDTQITSLLETFPLGVAITNFDGEFLAANKALVEMLCTSGTKLLQHKFSNFCVDPGQREKLLYRLGKSGTLRDFSLQLVREDGNSFIASLNSSRLLLDGEEFILVVVDDISEQISAEHEAAVLEERERLARELHDAVTQTLFSASVIAQASPVLLDKNPAAARQNMEHLAVLIRGALAEMRALLFELRPGAFKDQNMAELFDMLAESTRARTQANISLNINSSCSPPEEVAIAFYRITQESLNNIAKHALASEVVVDVRCNSKAAKLTIKDDGRGFDLQDIPAGHFGVSIMQERAQKIGAVMKIDSCPGKGTLVSVIWLAPQNERLYE